eukprot:COSAG06_NODE_7234_length_2577_cov_28.739306_5_plen_64_part_00
MRLKLGQVLQEWAVYTLWQREQRLQQAITAAKAVRERLFYYMCTIFDAKLKHEELSRQARDSV